MHPSRGGGTPRRWRRGRWEAPRGRGAGRRPRGGAGPVRGSSWPARGVGGWDALCLAGFNRPLSCQVWKHEITVTRWGGGEGAGESSSAGPGAPCGVWSGGGGRGGSWSWAGSVLPPPGRRLSRFPCLFPSLPPSGLDARVPPARSMAFQEVTLQQPLWWARKRLALEHRRQKLMRTWQLQQNLDWLVIAQPQEKVRLFCPGD